MRIRRTISLAVLFLAAVIGPLAQDKAAVQMDKPGPFKAGGPIAFDVNLNEPLPKGARFDFRVSPVAGDPEIQLASTEVVDPSQKKFRVSGTLPDGAVPGEWRISVIYLFLQGSNWTHLTIAPNDLRFQVEGKPYPIPTKAEVTVAR